MHSKKQETGGSCTSSPGDKIKSAVAHKPAGMSRLNSTGGSHSRGSGNEKK
jgi:hypothetical protein